MVSKTNVFSRYSIKGIYSEMTFTNFYTALCFAEMTLVRARKRKIGKPHKDCKYSRKAAASGPADQELGLLLLHVRWQTTVQEGAGEEE